MGHCKTKHLTHFVENTDTLQTEVNYLFHIAQLSCVFLLKTRTFQIFNRKNCTFDLCALEGGTLKANTCIQMNYCQPEKYPDVSVAAILMAGIQTSSHTVT